MEVTHSKKDYTVKKYLLPLLTLSLFCGNAGAKVLSCDSCTPAEMFSVADDYLQGIGPVEPAYVTDMHNQSVRKYGYYNNWTPDFDPETDGLIEWSEEMAVEPEIVAVVQAFPMADFPRTSAYRAQAINSAWDVVNSPTKEAAVIEHASTHWQVILARITDWTRGINPYPWFDPKEVSTAVELVFPDGSKMYIDINKKTAKWERIKGTAVDSNKNIIPETRLDFTGGQDGRREYEFVNTNSIPDLERFLRQAELYQIPVTGSQGSGQYYGVACSWVNGIATCIVVAR